LEHGIAVLSLVSPKIPGEKWHFAYLRIKDSVRPSYCLISAATISELAQKTEDSNINTLLRDSLVFVYDKATISQLSSLRIELNKLEIIFVNELLALFYPIYKPEDLEDISQRLQIRQKPFCTPAQKKVRVLWEIVKRCWQKGLNEDLGFINRLQELTKGLSCHIFLKLLEKEIIKRFPDRPITTEPYSNMLDNLFEEEEKQGDENVPISSEWAELSFRPGGLLSKSFPGYEPREMQTIMAQAIVDSFVRSQNLVVEAGTGTGKSIAYLIPAIWWAKRNKKRVVIATHTINLQEQLCKKDLPFLHNILPFGFKQVLLKGKNNYVCLQALNYEKAIADFSDLERFIYAAMLSWVRETDSGDLAEIEAFQNMSSFWRKYGADNPDCRPSECRLAERCFMLRARRKAENADIVIINHSLLLADIKTNYSILPEYEDLIIDEAHNLYPTALKQFGFEITREKICKLMENIAGNKGSLVAVLKKDLPLWTEIFPEGNWSELFQVLDQMTIQGKRIQSHATELFEFLQSIIGERVNLRLCRTKLGDQVYKAFIVMLENLSSTLMEIKQNLTKTYACLSADMKQLEIYRLEVGRINNEVGQIIDGLELIVAGEDDNRITYLEKSNVVYLKNTAIDIAGVLREKIFQKNNSTILTSATLTVAGQFDYFAQELGLENYKALKLDSPFNYERQMMFCIVDDLPILQTPENVLAQKTAYFIAGISKSLHGRTLVLFTSHRYLRLVDHYLRQELRNSPLRILAQGLDGSRGTLLQDFIRNNRSILLGTSSFWEGVDIPGDNLSCVIMTRLPFWPPDSPIYEAKARLYAEKGKDPFYELYLPEAIIRFKQGFGRLIRTKDDKGTVILLDDRIITKQYGQHFLKSLPVSRHFCGSSEEIINLVEKQNAMV